jgi:hypothetical protein
MDRKNSIFTKTLIVSLAILLLLANTGISIRAHFCHGNLSQIIAYSEFGVSKEILCNCNVDIKVNSKSDTSEEQIHRNQCCKNTYTFNKLHIESSISFSYPLSDIAIPILKLRELVQPSNTETSDNKIFTPPILPNISGRKLILFLSQIRSPAFTF